MTFKELEALMVKHGAVIRAITENERIIVEKRHADQFPNAKIKFLPEFNRERWTICLGMYKTFGRYCKI